MAEQSADQEPTMEEILASIRRIINEDEDQAGQGEAQPGPEAAVEPEAGPEPEFEPASEPEPEPEPAFEAAPEPEPEPDFDPADDDDVLELTERVEEEDSVGTDPMAVSDDLMIVDREDEPEPAVEPDETVYETQEEDEALLDQAAAGAAASAFSALAANMRISEQPGQTLEAIVRELIRPMLKEWLDANLPGIVEAKVEAEIERVARRRG